MCSGGKSRSSASRSSMYARAELVVPRSMPIFMLVPAYVSGRGRCYVAAGSAEKPALWKVFPPCLRRTRGGLSAPVCQARVPGPAHRLRVQPLPGKVEVTATSVVVTLDKRAHKPYLAASGLADQPTPLGPSGKAEPLSAPIRPREGS